MKKVKSILSTVVFFLIILGIFYFIPLPMKKERKEDIPIITEEEQLLGMIEDTLDMEKVEVVEIEPVVNEMETSKSIEKEKSKPEIIEEPVKEEKQKIKQLEVKKEEYQKSDQKLKEEEKKKEQKESKIGVDRKLLSGIPGTMKYKGKFPQHNVKEKGNITISYTVDAEGNVVSAYRIDGLRDRNTINNAISMLKKYVKAEKSKGESVGTYTIEFK